MRSASPALALPARIRADSSPSERLNWLLTGLVDLPLAPLTPARKDALVEGLITFVRAYRLLDPELPDIPCNLHKVQTILRRLFTGMERGDHVAFPIQSCLDIGGGAVDKVRWYLKGSLLDLILLATFFTLRDAYPKRVYRCQFEHCRRLIPRRRNQKWCATHKREVRGDQVRRARRTYRRRLQDLDRLGRA